MMMERSLPDPVIRRASGQWRHRDGMARRLSDALERFYSSVKSLDYMVQSSPLREAWQVRAALYGACQVARAFGQYPDVDHVWAVHMGVPLGDLDSFEAGRRGWDSFSVLLRGAVLSPFLLGCLGRDAVAGVRACPSCPVPLEERLLVPLKGHERASILDLVEEMAAGLRLAVDPGWYERQHRLRMDLAAAARDLGRVLVWPDPVEPFDNGRLYLEVPWRLLEMGVTGGYYPCLIGLSVRMARERRLDDRALLGTLAALHADAENGLAILRDMESAFLGIVRRIGSQRADSVLPRVVMAMLAMPSVDTGVLAMALREHHALGAADRVVQKVMRRLVEEGVAVDCSGSKTGRSGRGDGCSGHVFGLAAGIAGMTQVVRRRPRQRGMMVRATMADPARAWISGQKLAREAEPSCDSMEDIYAWFRQSLSEIDEAYGRWFVRRSPEELRAMAEARTDF